MFGYLLTIVSSSTTTHPVSDILTTKERFPLDVRTWFNATVAVIDGGNFLLHKVTVYPWTPVHNMHDEIRNALIRGSILGRSFESSLDILPLPKMPTFSELQGENLDDLHLKACRKLMDLPHEELATFFNFFAEKPDPLEEHIHFIVWLPAESGECLFPLHIYFLTFMLPKSDFHPTLTPPSTGS